MPPGARLSVPARRSPCGERYPGCACFRLRGSGCDPRMCRAWLLYRFAAGWYFSYGVNFTGRQRDLCRPAQDFAPRQWDDRAGALRRRRTRDDDGRGGVRLPDHGASLPADHAAWCDPHAVPGCLQSWRRRMPVHRLALVLASRRMRCSAGRRRPCCGASSTPDWATCANPRRAGPDRATAERRKSGTAHPVDGGRSSVVNS